MLDPSPAIPSSGDRAAGAMCCDLGQRPIHELTAAHLKATSAHGAFDMQAGQVHDQRLQEEDAVQCGGLR